MLKTSRPTQKYKTIKYFKFRVALTWNSPIDKLVSLPILQPKNKNSGFCKNLQNLRNLAGFTNFYSITLSTKSHSTSGTNRILQNSPEATSQPRMHLYNPKLESKHLATYHNKIHTNSSTFHQLLTKIPPDQYP